MKKSVKSIVVLLCICVTVAVLMAVTNYITAPIIAGNEQGKSNEALLEVLPEGGNFELVDISAYTLPESVAEVYKASNGGYVIKINTTGYAPGMVLMCGTSNPSCPRWSRKLRISWKITPLCGALLAAAGRPHGSIIQMVFPMKLQKQVVNSYLT